MPASPMHTVRGTEALLARLTERLSERFPTHPFEAGIRADNFERVIGDYLAMSIAFPYIQAGAIHETYRRAVETSGDTNANTEVTAAVGSFLVWDEFGGHALIRENGDAGLLQLTRVGEHFHSHLLRRDIETLLGHSVRPHRSAATREYLDGLLRGLSDPRGNRNVAQMVAFEQHANDMIEALWTAVHRVFGVPKDARLAYFYEHVGGDSPAEAVHVEMTQNMLSDLVPSYEHEEFLETCVNAYAHSVRWCEAIL
jgi:hypothetical protein